jgi:hypothetical protein
MSVELNGPIVGFPEEWHSFFQRHPSWPTVLERLRQVLEKAFVRDVELETRAEKVIFFMGRLCVEDFNEVFLLAANGCGFGSMKFLRGLYERVVTIAYISRNPDEATSFLEYHYVHRGKLLQHAESFLGGLEAYIDRAEIAEAKSDFLQHQDRFMQTKCKKCGTKSLMHSWSKLDIASMAKKTDLHTLYFPGYYYPTLQAHATTASVIYRLNGSQNEPVSFDGGSQPNAADRSLIVAHNLIIRLVHIEDEFFKLNLTRDSERLGEDFKAIWGRDENGEDPKKNEV